MRVFLGFRPSPEIRELLRSAWERVPSQPIGLRPITEENWHVTMAFLGEVDDGMFDNIEWDVEAWCKKMPKLQFKISTLETFPGKNPRYMAARLDPVEPKDLGDSLEKLRDILSVSAPSIDRKPWRPHVSIGKSRSGVALPKWTTDIEPIEMTVPELKLIKSETSPTGSWYTDLKAFPLL